MEQIGGRPGGRNPLHYNGASSPRALEVTIHAAWTLGGGADRGGAPGVAIRCTIMVLRRLWVHKMTRFHVILARNPLESLYISPNYSRSLFQCRNYYESRRV